MRRDKVVQEVLGDENVITPSDLCHHEFKRVTMGGYRPEDVDQLLERVADVMESLNEQVRRLKIENESLRERLAEQRASENVMREALVSTQRTSESIIEAARRQADAVIEEAKAERARIRADQARVPEVIENEIRLLRQQRERFRTQFISVLETHRRLLDDLIPPLDPVAPSRSDLDAVSHAAHAAHAATDADAGAETAAAEPDAENGDTPGEDAPRADAAQRERSSDYADLIGMAPAQPDPAEQPPRDRPGKVDLHPDTEAELNALMAHVAEDRAAENATAEKPQDAADPEDADAMDASDPDRRDAD